MRKNIRRYIAAFIAGALIFGISAAFAYSYFAQNVGFSPTDENWDVENAKEALDNLYDQTNEYNYLKSFGMLFNLKFNTYVDDVKYLIHIVFMISFIYLDGIVKALHKLLLKIIL